MVQRIAKDSQRAEMLVYLSTLTDGDPVAFPEPATPAEPATEGEG